MDLVLCLILFVILMVVQICVVINQLFNGTGFKSMNEFYLNFIPFFWVYYIIKKVRSIEGETLRKIHGKE